MYLCMVLATATYKLGAAHPGMWAAGDAGLIHVHLGPVPAVFAAAVQGHRLCTSQVSCRKKGKKCKYEKSCTEAMALKG